MNRINIKELLSNVQEKKNSPIYFATANPSYKRSPDSVFQISLFLTKQRQSLTPELFQSGVTPHP
jgi:hypothetical protein